MKLVTRGMIAVLCVSCLVSCVSVNVDSALGKTMSASEKADRFVAAGNAVFNDAVVKKQLFSEIVTAKNHFNLALQVDPWNLGAEAAIEHLDNYIGQQVKKFTKILTNLYQKESLTDAEMYDFVYAAYAITVLTGVEPSINEKKISVSSPRRVVTNQRTTRLAEITKLIAATEDCSVIGRLAKEADSLFDELQRIGAYGSTEEKQRTVVEARLWFMVRDTTVTARAKLEKREYGASNKALISADKAISSVYSLPVHELELLKHELYIRWTAALISVSAYEQADATIDKALAIMDSAEGRKYKNKIAVAAAAPKRLPKKKPVVKTDDSAVTVVAARDYDAEINDICANIDQYIREKELLQAWNFSVEAREHITVPENIAQLDALDERILASLIPLYTRGIELFNEEDYESAADNFKKVIEIQPNYEEAQAYFDRCTTKIKALSGIQ